MRKEKIMPKSAQNLPNHNPPFKARDQGLGITPADCEPKMARDLSRRGKKIVSYSK